MMKNLLFLSCFLGAIGAVAAPAPNFTVTTSDNQTIQLYQNFISQGKVVVIEAFFIACPPCGTHAPLLQNLYTQMQAAHPGKVEFILLSTQSGDVNTSVASYKVSKGLTMPAVGSNGGSLTALQPYTSGQFGQFLGTPTFIVIAPNTGEVHFDIRGGSPSQTIAKLGQKIEELLPPPFVPTYCSVKDAFNNSLNGVELKVSAPPFDTTIVANGNYTLSTVTSLANKSYTIKPQLEDNPLNGLTTYDLVLISKHILGIEALKCDWQRLAADVNCSGTITTFDIVTARKLILGIDQELPCGSWRFSPDSATASNGDCMAFLGAKTGDVTAGVCNELAPLPEDRESWHFVVEDRMVSAGETVAVRVRAEKTIDVLGLQAAFSIDHNNGLIQSLGAPGLSGFDPENYSLNHSGNSTARVSWITPFNQSIDPAIPVFLLEVHAKKTGNLSDLLRLGTSAGLRPECYDAQGGIHPMGISWRAASDASVGQTSSFHCFPNPNPGTFTLSTMGDRDAECLVEVVDLQGKTIYQNIFQSHKGHQTWQVDAGGSAPGFYFLRVNGSIVGKIAIR